MYVTDVCTANCCIVYAHQIAYKMIASKIPFFLFRMNSSCPPINKEYITYGSDVMFKTVGGTQSNVAFITCHSEIIIVA